MSAPLRRPPSAPPDPVARRVAGGGAGRLVAVAILALAGALASASSALAADGDATWSVRPQGDAQDEQRPNFQYQLDPGGAVEDALVVTNRGTEALDLTVYAADAFVTSSGEYDLLPAGTPSTDLGTWVRVGLDRLTLAPGEQARVPFTVTVPADASPGDHAGGVVTSSLTSDGSTVAIDRRLGTRIQVRVGGELAPAAGVSGVRATYHPSWNPFGAGTVTVDYMLADTGNTRVTATESVRVAGPAGVGAAASPAGQAPELLAGTTLARQVSVPGVWPSVRLGVDLRVDAEGVGLGAGAVAPALAHVSVWAVPWAQLVLVALVVVVAALGPRAVEFVRRRRGARVRGAADDEPLSAPAAP